MLNKDRVVGGDRTIIRDLARRVAQAAASPVMEHRRRLWRLHNSLRPARPMILVFPEGSWRELLPETALKCATAEARNIESQLRMTLYAHEHFDHDHVVERQWNVYKAIKNSGWGLEAKWHRSSDPTGARTFNPVLLERSDLKKIKAPRIGVDEAETRRRLDRANDLLGDILDVRPRGVNQAHFHLMSLYTSWRGLDRAMMDMIENPGMLHEAMSIITQGCQGVMRQYERLNLLDTNNDGTYQGSGGNGWTDELPGAGFDPARVRPCDMWASAESQELAQVSPEMHEEFALAYERRLLAPFGLSAYGCCEDLTRKLDYVLKIPNIRRISMSPWADVPRCAERLGGRAIFSWKPHPGHLVGRFDERAIRSYIRAALDAARGCVVEIVLKDTHTCENRPERFDRWTKIAREEVDRFASGTR